MFLLYKATNNTSPALVYAEEKYLCEGFKVVIKILAINEIHNLDCLEGLKQLDNNSVHCCVTSPPYWGLRDYGVEGQLGLEPTPELYVEHMVEIFKEVRRVLRDDGTLWLNLGDSYAGNREKATVSSTSTCGNTKADVCAKVNKVVSGLKPKDLVGIPWMVAFALRADGWYLRNDIIWHKPNAMPESVTDRCTKAHEYIFLLSKDAKYFYDTDAIREPDQDKYDGRRGATKTRKKMQSAMRDFSDKDTMHRYSTNGRNKRTVWTVPTKPYKGAHFATFPTKLIEPCILAGTSPQACEKCGAPWERVVEREGITAPRGTEPCKVARGVKGQADRSIPGGYSPRVTTLGWQPTCTCENEGKGQCVVLDPFIGSGTTAMVATQNKRNFIGFELNPEYIKLAKERINNVQLKIVL